MKKAIIVGHTGQDGYYLSELLLKNGYEVIGISSKHTTDNNFGIGQVDILKQEEVKSLMTKVKPDEIYFLAAVHQSSVDVEVDDGDLFQMSIDVNVKALVIFLECIRTISPNSKMFYAASSHIFGSPDLSPQNESTPLKPTCVYGITKTAGVETCRYYRENYSVFVNIGIFYNHESPRRASKFVSKKIVEGAVAIKNDKQKEIILGDLESQIDWGYAPDYMLGVHEIMKLSKSDDFVISSGAKHTIKDFVLEVFNILNLNWKEYVKIDSRLITKKQKKNLFGDNSKIFKSINWKPSVSFKELVKILVEEEQLKYV